LTKLPRLFGIGNHFFNSLSNFKIRSRRSLRILILSCSIVKHESMFVSIL
jgi:hypothetical protein